MSQIRLETGICHFRVDRDIDLTDFIDIADLSPLSVEKQTVFWLDHGCVYVDGKRQRENTRLSTGQILRLHTKPKFYTRRFHKLSDHIIFEHEDFLVLDKPSGLPTHATLDNYRDNAKFILEEELGRTLFTTHRLDIPTLGLLVIAKSPLAQSRINKLFAKGRVSKRYLALAEVLVPPARYDHYMDREGRAPRKLSEDAREGWWNCSMEIEEVVGLNGLYRHKIRLMTGRTHQIRAQMSHLGAPLVGDSLYGSTIPKDDEIGLECWELGFRYLNENFLWRRG